MSVNPKLLKDEFTDKYYKQEFEHDKTLFNPSKAILSGCSVGSLSSSNLVTLRREPSARTLKPLRLPEGKQAERAALDLTARTIDRQIERKIYLSVRNNSFAQHQERPAYCSEEPGSNKFANVIMQPKSSATSSQVNLRGSIKKARSRDLESIRKLPDDSAYSEPEPHLAFYSNLRRRQRKAEIQGPLKLKQFDGPQANASVLTAVSKL